MWCASNEKIKCKLNMHGDGCAHLMGLKNAFILRIMMHVYLYTFSLFRWCRQLKLESIHLKYKQEQYKYPDEQQQSDIDQLGGCLQIGRIQKQNKPYEFRLCKL